MAEINHGFPGAPTLLGALEVLGRDDLAAVLRSRPEAAEVVSMSNPSLQVLAADLSRPNGIGRALSEVNEFLLRLLIVTTWLGSVVTTKDLRRQTPGVSNKELGAGLKSLTHKALAFPVISGASNEPSVWVPDCVAQVVETMGAPGPRLRPALEPLTVDELDGIAGRLGLRWAKRPRKDVILDELISVLSAPATVDSLVAPAPKEAHEALSLIRANGGRLGWHELEQEGLADSSDYGYSYSPPSSYGSSALTWLSARALALPDPESRWRGVRGEVFVSGEVEVALRGGLLFQEWQPRPPEAQSTVSAATADRGPEQIVSDADALLAEWASAPAPQLKAGGLGVRELRKAAQRTGIDERLTQFLYALLVDAELLCYVGATVTASAEASEWAHRAPAEKWSTLFDAWRGALLWSESEEGLVPLSSRPFIDHSLTRSAVLEVLQATASGTTIDLASLGRRLVWARPHLFHCDDCASRLAERTVEGLTMLGTVCVDRGIGLIEPARSALAGFDWTSSTNGSSSAFPAPVEECTVQADLTVIVPGPPAPDLGRGLARFTELKTSSPARVYRISDGSVRRALDLGMTAEEMLSVLERHAPKGVPQSVAYLIEDVARRHGRVTLGEGGVYIKADDPGLLNAVVSDRCIQKLDPRILAPTVAVVASTTVDALLKALRQAGHMPVAEDGGALINAAGQNQRPILKISGRGPAQGMQIDEASALVDVLLTERVPDGDAPAPDTIATNRTQVLSVLRLAEEEHLAVELGYRTAKGTNVHRVEPIVVSRRQLSGWSLESAGPKKFEITRIQWVRTLDQEEADALYER